MMQTWKSIRTNSFYYFLQIIVNVLFAFYFERDADFRMIFILLIISTGALLAHWLIAAKETVQHLVFGTSFFIQTICIAGLNLHFRGNSFEIHFIYSVLLIIWIMSANQLATSYFRVGISLFVYFVCLLIGGGFAEVTSASVVIPIIFSVFALIAQHSIKELSNKLEISNNEMFELRNRNSIMYSNMMDVFWTYDLKTQKFTYVSPSVFQLRGYTPEEVVNQSFKDIITSASFAKISFFINENNQIEEYSALPQNFLINDLEQICKNGSIILTEVATSLVYDKNGHPTSVVGVTRNITERRKAEEDLANQLSLLESLLSAIPHPVFYMNHEAKYMGCNKAFEQLMGLSKESLMGKTIAERLQTKESELFLQRDIQLINQSGTQRYEERIQSRDGNFIDTIISKATYRDTNGEVAGLVCVIMDVTEIKRLEAELKKSNEILMQHYSESLEKVQSYSKELQIKQNELLKLQRDNLQSQFEALKNQVNPHFLFNSLNVLSSLISVNQELAEKFTINLSKIYRYILDHRSEDLVSLFTELEFLNSYVFLLKSRFEEKILVEIKIDPAYLEYKLPPLALQLLIENAIKHNVYSLKSPLRIQIFVDENHLLNIINNFQKREKPISSTKIGLKNITDRYRYFSDEEPFFGFENTHFVARIPLLK